MYITVHVFTISGCESSLVKSALFQSLKGNLGIKKYASSLSLHFCVMCSKTAASSPRHVYCHMQIQVSLNLSWCIEFAMLYKVFIVCLCVTVFLL